MVYNTLCDMLCYIFYCMKHSTQSVFSTFNFFEVQKFNFLKFKILELKFFFVAQFHPHPLQLPLQLRIQPVLPWIAETGILGRQ